MAASNTRDCFRECIGHTVIGVLFDALPIERYDLAKGNKTLVFDDGTGLTFSSSGSYWRENAANIARATAKAEERLRRTQGEIAAVLELAGRLASKASS